MMVIQNTDFQVYHLVQLIIYVLKVDYFRYLYRHFNMKMGMPDLTSLYLLSFKLK